MKSFFKNRTRREQLLILVFALVALGWWGGSLLPRGRAEIRAWNGVLTQKATQALWFSNQEEIQARVVAAGQALDSSRTLDSAQAFAELNKMLSGLTAEVTFQHTDRSDQFALHSMEVNIRQADMAELLRFYRQLLERAPYLGIDQCVLTADRNRSVTIDAHFRIYSIEMDPSSGSPR